MAADVPSGKHEFVGQALDEFEGPLTRYAMRLLGDLDMARDVVQETFLRLCAEDRNRVEDHLAQWLFAVCRNRAIDIRRKESRMNQFPTGGQPESCTSQDESPAAVMERRETAGQVLAELETLPPNQQEVVRLKFQNGLTYKEISHVTSLSVSNVGFLIHTALKTLRRRMHVEPTSPRPNVAPS